MSIYGGGKIARNTSSNDEAGMETQDTGNTLPARLLTVRELASFLGVHASTIRRWEREGLLKSYVIGLRRNVRFKQEDVVNFLHRSRKGGKEVS